MVAVLLAQNIEQYCRTKRMSNNMDFALKLRVSLLKEVDDPIRLISDNFGNFLPVGTLVQQHVKS